MAQHTNGYQPTELKHAWGLTGILADEDLESHFGILTISGGAAGHQSHIVYSELPITEQELRTLQAEISDLFRSKPIDVLGSLHSLLEESGYQLLNVVHIFV